LFGPEEWGKLYDAAVGEKQKVSQLFCNYCSLIFCSVTGFVVTAGWTCSAKHKPRA